LRYQDVFQCLKGVGSVDLSALVLPVRDFPYGLHPVNCREGRIDRSVVQMLTSARNMHADSFLTKFVATPARTELWLSQYVAADPTRILFTVRDFISGEFYGYMGLAYGDPTGSRIEGDAIVRFSDSLLPGLMKAAFIRMVEWASQDIGISEVWVRVLADNPAVAFYEACGFERTREAPLYENRGASGDLEELSEDPQVESWLLSDRALVYMRYSKK